MKIFIDTANIEEIKKAGELGVLDGVTTNPTLISREKRGFVDILEDICRLVDGPISAEVVSLDYEGMLREARSLSGIHKNIIIKIPLTKDGLRAVNILAGEGVKCNVTLCFSPLQALLAAKAKAAYISPFIGRLDDIAHTGMDLVRRIRQIYDKYSFKTEIIVASIRHPVHVLEAAMAGADIATIPYKVIEQLIKHPLTDIGIKRFLEDWKGVPEPEIFKKAKTD
ncbi:MAG: fructose-6-phosphate aldolase [Candidatus Omnitrophica bacterium]|nr:fructose-6-phosphate aldolase [Candidatus Omnitrophota bacterium]